MTNTDPTNPNRAEKRPPVIVRQDTFALSPFDDWPREAHEQGENFARLINNSDYSSSDYESAMQTMLWRGVAWIAEHDYPPSIWEGTGDYPGVTGLMVEGNDIIKELGDFISRDLDPTGAMYHIVMKHLSGIHQLGVDKWREIGREMGRREFTWEGEL